MVDHFGGQMEYALGCLQRRRRSRRGLARVGQLTATSKSSLSRFRSPKPASMCRPSCATPKCTSGCTGRRSRQWSVVSRQWERKEIAMPDDTTFPECMLKRAIPALTRLPECQPRLPRLSASPPQGPFTPTMINSFSEYESMFGSPNGGGFLGYAVRGFFDNGGAQCYVVRIEATADPAESLQASRKPGCLDRLLARRRLDFWYGRGR